MFKKGYKKFKIMILFKLSLTNANNKVFSFHIFKSIYAKKKISPPDASDDEKLFLFYYAKQRYAKYPA